MGGWMDRCVGGGEAACPMLSPPGRLPWRTLEVEKPQLLIPEVYLAERSHRQEEPRLAQAAGFVQLHSSNFHASCQVRFFTTSSLAWKCGKSNHTVPEPVGLLSPEPQRAPPHPQLPWAVCSGHRPEDRALPCWSTLLGQISELSSDQN